MDEDKRSQPQDNAKRPLTERVARGAIWIVAARFIVRSLGLINTFILARLLVPGDFGVVAIGLTVMQLLQNLSDIGVSQAVVRFRDATRDHFDTLFTLSIIRGVIVGAILLSVSYFASDFYKDERVGTVFMVLAVAPIIQSLVNPRFFEFERDLDFSREFMASGINKIVGVVISVSIALTFGNYAAILGGLVAGLTAQTILSYLFRPYAPRLTFSKLRELFSFTGWVTGLSIVSALNNKLDMLIVGRFIGPAQTGAYYLGSSVAAIPSTEIAHPIARAIYPGLSELQKKPAQMKEAYLRGVEALSMIAMPATFGCSFVAADLVAILLGSQWDLAVPLVRYLAPAAGVLLLSSAVQSYALARGMPREAFWRYLLFFCIRMPFFIWATATYGMMGAVYAVAIGWLFLTFVQLTLYMRISGGGFFDTFVKVRRSAFGVGVMAAYFLGLRPHLAMIDGLGLFARFICDVGVAAMIYIGAVYAVWRAEGSPESVEDKILKLVSARWEKLKLRTP